MNCFENSRSIYSRIFIDQANCELRCFALPFSITENGFKQTKKREKKGRQLCSLEASFFFLSRKRTLTQIRKSSSIIITIIFINILLKSSTFSRHISPFIVRVEEKVDETNFVFFLFPKNEIMYFPAFPLSAKNKEKKETAKKKEFETLVPPMRICVEVLLVNRINERSSFLKLVHYAEKDGKRLA